MNAAKGSLAKLKTRLGELTVSTDQQQQQQQQQQAPVAAKQAVYIAPQEPLLSPRSQQADRDAKQELLEVCVLTCERSSLPLAAVSLLAQL